MKKIFIIIVFLISVFQPNLFAQKPDKEKLEKYQYTQLPNTPLPKEYKTYKVKAQSFNSYREDKIVEGFGIIGYSKVAEEEADFTISAKEYEVLFEGAEQKSVEKSKKVDGVEKKWKEYFYSFKVTHKVVVTVYDKNGNKVTDQTASEVGASYSSKESASTKEALELYKSYASNLKETLLNDKLSSLNSILNERIGFPIKSDYAHLYTVKAKKFNYDDYTKAFGLAVEGANIVIADENATEKAKTFFDQAAEIWKTALQESDVENKKTRVNKKVTAATYYNLGVCAWLLKDYENGIKLMEQVNAVDKGYSDASHYIDLMKNLLDRANKNKI